MGDPQGRRKPLHELFKVSRPDQRSATDPNSRNLPGFQKFENFCPANPKLTRRISY
jgi:hypothetical protein